MPTIALVRIDLDGYRLRIKDLETGEVYLDEELPLPERFVVEVYIGSSGVEYTLVEM